MQHDLLKRKRQTLTSISTLTHLHPHSVNSSLLCLFLSAHFFSQTCLLISQNVRAILTVLIYSYFPAVIRCHIYTFPDSALAFWMSADIFQMDNLKSLRFQPRTLDLKHEFRRLTIIWDCMCLYIWTSIVLKVLNLQINWLQYDK